MILSEEQVNELRNNLSKSRGLSCVDITRILNSHEQLRAQLVRMQETVKAYIVATVRYPRNQDEKAMNAASDALIESVSIGIEDVADKLKALDSDSDDMARRGAK